MNEPSDFLYRSALRRKGNRSTIWAGAAILALIVATSIYIGRAGEKNEPAVPVVTNNAAANSTNTSEKTIDTKSMSDPELRKKLTSEQYRVTCESGTEPPFRNAYWDNHKPGIYVDLISGKALFASTDKFESGTGWPSFTKPIDPANVVTKTDQTLFMERTEVRSKESNAHLGHVFDDGPQPTGMRYCINSAALRFVPVEKMQEEGYGRYLNLFEKTAKK